MISISLRKIIRALWQAVYRTYCIRQNVEFGSGLHVGIGSILWAPNRLKIGRNVYIGKFCTIECDGRIGDDTMIANNVGIIGRHDHDFRCVGKTIRNAPWVGDKHASAQGEGMEVHIGSDVWIGYGAVLLSGVSVGRGAIVAAGSVVTTTVEPYSIVAGNPARVIGSRFSPQDVIEHERLLDLKLENKVKR